MFIIISQLQTLSYIQDTRIEKSLIEDGNVSKIRNRNQRKKRRSLVTKKSRKNSRRNQEEPFRKSNDDQHYHQSQYAPAIKFYSQHKEKPPATSTSSTNSKLSSKQFEIHEKFEKCHEQCLGSNEVNYGDVLVDDNEYDDNKYNSSRDYVKSSYNIATSKQKSKLRTECCRGGVSFLKVALKGIERGGKLYFNTVNPCSTMDTSPSPSRRLINERPIVDKVSPSKYSKGSKGGQNTGTGSNLFDLRFVSCNDVCTNPFYDQSCSSSSKIIEITNDNDDICFGTWDSIHNKILFHEKMPMSVLLTYELQNHNSQDYHRQTTFTADIHTSCSKPLHPPYATTLASSCGEESPEYFTYDPNMSTPLIQFKDGISAGYYKYDLGQNLTSPSPFSYNFEKCRCVCDGNQEIPSPSPVIPIPTNISPINSPRVPTVSVISTPSSFASSQTNSCNDQCLAWVSANCVIPADSLNPERECASERSGTLRKLFDVSLLMTSVSDENIVDLIEYHDKMQELHLRLLELI